jgi:hypothetical protein
MNHKSSFDRQKAIDDCLASYDVLWTSIESFHIGNREMYRPVDLLPENRTGDNASPQVGG